MYGILLVLLGTCFGESAQSIGKRGIMDGKQSLYLTGFLLTFWTTCFFLAIAILKPDAFVFSLSSLPTFLPRIMLEVLLSYLFIRAMAVADRSTFGFLRILTLPLLLFFDIILGYDMSIFQYAGVLLMGVVLAWLLFNHGIEKRGSGLVLSTAFLAVVTLSLFKYDITHFNSVVAEQLIVHCFVTCFFGIMTVSVARENPFVFFRNRVLLLQSVASGVAGLLESFAYQYAPASVVTAAKRAGGVLWSILGGRMYFHEGAVVKKVIGFIFLTIALALLAV
ncbi:MAG: hypothetical protein AAB932_05490 [Patescibacteria group bacterium]